MGIVCIKESTTVWLPEGRRSPRAYDKDSLVTTVEFADGRVRKVAKSIGKVWCKVATQYYKTRQYSLRYTRGLPQYCITLVSPRWTFSQLPSTQSKFSCISFSLFPSASSFSAVIL
ncbi:unnamed protein product [Macrosiphum euphorbiae]|uniref:Uncharacterized protein n=1 Tax=Macrosiphum euphorbiae TaxID=13131 RepID=A0AAV0W5Q6_9HEMI|nr:unnamed protein product [Macrosiphum euphorbiae]